MHEQITPASILETLGEKLTLSVWAGAEYLNNPFSHHSFSDDSASLVGYFNSIHTSQVQVIGSVEKNYISNLPEAEQEQVLTRMFAASTVAVCVSDSLQPPASLERFAKRYQTPIFCSSSSSPELITRLRYFLSHSLADKEILHGVFMEIISLGVLLTGESGLGKSELALELITRGHRLIADDAPEFMRVSPDTITGKCPPMLLDFLEVRGLGVLNIREMYGDSSIKLSKYLRLILHLTPFNQAPEDRLSSIQDTKNILGLDIPVIPLPVAPGRNLAVLAEAAVRNHLLRGSGHDASADFIQRQHKAIAEDRG
jgi:HPr kinase/phosphorylase